ncbi:MAG: hypothetical protein IJU91_03360 [Selenomonadaceae bacterium]|nr:hypothetical protein [Selenomonadaceae bacterium]
MIENVMIDTVNYRVTQTDETIIDGDAVCGGEVDFITSHIRLNNALGESAKIKVLMHEIFHAMLYERGMDDFQDEKLINALASGTVNLIRDNPELVDLLKIK